MNARNILRLVAERYGLNSEEMKMEVERDNIKENEDIIHNAQSAYSHICHNSGIKERLVKVGWSLSGCSKLLKVGDLEFKKLNNYYDEVLNNYMVHRVRMKKMLKEIRKMFDNV